MSDLRPERGRHRPLWIAIRWRLPGEGDDVHQRERPARQGIDPLREARSLAQAAGIPRGTVVVYSEHRLVLGATVTVGGATMHVAELWIQERSGEFRWEHGR